MDIKAILECIPYSTLPGETESKVANAFRKESRNTSANPKDLEVTARVLSTMMLSRKSGDALVTQLQSLVSDRDRTESLAKVILDTIIEEILPGGKLGSNLLGAMSETYQLMKTYVKVWLKDYPALHGVESTILGIGILAKTLPWTIEALGFRDDEPIDGSFAAWWKAIFPEGEPGSLLLWLNKCE